MFCTVVMEKFGCADSVSNPRAEYSIYAVTQKPLEDGTRF